MLSCLELWRGASPGSPVPSLTALHHIQISKKSIRCTLEFLNKKRIDFGQGLDFLNFSIRHFEIEGLTSYLNNSHLIFLAYNIQPHERVKKNKKETTYITFFFLPRLFFFFYLLASGCKSPAFFISNSDSTLKQIRPGTGFSGLDSEIYFPK